MKLNRFAVSFEQQDMYFLKKHGLFKATSIVRNHYNRNKTPFINDTYQLAYEVGVLRKKLFELSKHTKKHYKLIMLRKKNGGLRYIHSPDSVLKNAQSRILRNILEHIEISPYATAYIKGKKTEDNATLRSDLSAVYGVWQGE